MFFASVFAKPMKPIKCVAFLFTFCFYVYFARSYESRSINWDDMVNKLTTVEKFERERFERLPFVQANSL